MLNKIILLKLLLFSFCNAAQLKKAQPSNIKELAQDQRIVFIHNVLPYLFDANFPEALCNGLNELLSCKNVSRSWQCAVKQFMQRSELRTA